MRANENIKVGTLHVTSFRPFPGPEIVEALKSVKAIAVFERMDNPTAQSNPLTAEIKSAFADALSGAPGYPKIDRLPVSFPVPRVWAAATSARVTSVAVVNHMSAKKEQRFFVLGYSARVGPCRTIKSLTSVPKALFRCAATPWAATVR